MRQRKIRLIQDVVFLALSIFVAVFLVKAGVAEKIVYSFGDMKWLGIFLSGLFFTSVFTTAPSIAILGTFSETSSLWLLAILGGLGAVCGDYVLFRLMRDRVAEDFKYLFSFSKKHRFMAIFHTRIFRFIVPFIGGIIIASPLPDELGIAMLGMSKISNKVFFTISYIMNSAGILLIGFAARALVGSL